LGGLSRSLETRPDLRKNFEEAYDYMVMKVQEHPRMNADVYGEYAAVSFGKSPNEAQDRYVDERSKRFTDSLFGRFYERVEEDGHLTIESLAELYDYLGLRQPLLDGNGRAQSLAFSHILMGYGYPPPDLTKVTRDEVRQLYAPEVCVELAFYREFSLRIQDPHQ
jgi:hypothetical protein